MVQAVRPSRPSTRVLVTSNGAVSWIGRGGASVALVGADASGGSVGDEPVALADEAAGLEGLPEFESLPPHAEAARHTAVARSTAARTPGT